MSGSVSTPSGALRLEHESLAVPDVVRDVREGVAELARRGGGVEDLVDAVRLAVSEAVTNAVLHAYADRETPGPLNVEAWIDGDALLVLVCDHGGGMRPRPDTPGLGLGLPLVAQLADDFRVEERPGSGTKVSMRFSLDGSGTEFVR